jgi:hypothetical protein
VNVVEIFLLMYENGKVRPFETVSGVDKEEWWRGWIQIWFMVRTFVNVTLCPQYNHNMIIKMSKKKTIIHFSDIGFTEIVKCKYAVTHFFFLFIYLFIYFYSYVHTMFGSLLPTIFDLFWLNQFLPAYVIC